MSTHSLSLQTQEPGWFGQRWSVKITRIGRVGVEIGTVSQRTTQRPLSCFEETMLHAPSVNLFWVFIPPARLSWAWSPFQPEDFWGEEFDGCVWGTWNCAHKTAVVLQHTFPVAQKGQHFCSFHARQKQNISNLKPEALFRYNQPQWTLVSVPQQNRFPTTLCQIRPNRALLIQISRASHSVVCVMRVSAPPLPSRSDTSHRLRLRRIRHPIPS